MPTPQEREEALFDRALEMPVAERAAWLERECAGEAALLARLKKLIVAFDRPDALLESKPTATGLRDVTEPADLKPGQVLGRYKLVEKLGEGGCGVVYVAEQTEPVRRQVALKVIKLGMDTKQVVARFEAERQALAMMEHPGIAKVFDAGATEQGRPYFVMELVRGARITDYCDEHQLSTAARLDLFIKVCQAIQHAHQKGIIHRDIKPSNILVQLHDGVPVPKVIDFGIAKATDGRLTDATVYTQLHQFIGTPAYMSPEQAEMSGLDIDTRSDIYSLGVLLYELLTGKTPFDAKELIESGLDRMRKTIRETEPLRPSTKLAKLQGEELTSVVQRRFSDAPRLLRLLAGDLDWIVMKCLEKDRTRRYETANGLAADLKRHLDNEPVVACPPSTGYRFQKALRRNKLAFTAAAVVLVALLAGISASLWEAVRATRAEKLSEQRLDDSEKARTRAEASESRALAAEREATAKANAERAARAEAEAVSTFLTGIFRSPNPARDGRTITLVEALDAAAKKLEKDLADQPGRRATFQNALGETYSSLGLYKESIALREKVRDFYLKKSGLEHPDTLSAMHELANSYFLDGRVNEAIKLQEEVLKMRRKVLGAEHNDTLQTMLSLSLSYHNSNRIDESLKLREEVLAVRRKVLGPNHFETLWALKALAQSYHTEGRYEEALKMREEVLAMRRAALSPEHPQTLGAIADLAQSYHAVGRFDEALKLREEVLPLFRKVSGPNHPDTLRAMQALSDSYLAVGRTKDMLPMMVDASIRNPANTGAALKLAALQLWFGMEADYAKTCQRMLDWGNGSKNPTSADQVARLLSLHDSSDQRRNDAASSLARRAEQLRQEKGLAQWYQMTLGMAEYRSGHFADADAALFSAAKGAKTSSRLFTISNFYRAMCLFRQGRESEARQLFTGTEAKMAPLPADDQNPLADPQTSPDDLIQWLAYKEARTLLNAPRSAKQTGTTGTGRD